MKRPTAVSRAVLVLLLLAGPSSVGAQRHARHEEKQDAAGLPAVIWRDPGDARALNLLDGAGGSAHRPNPNARYAFVKEDPNGVSPKFDVVDDNGVRWRVKLNISRAHHREPQSETAATRLVWAAGYFTDEDYYLPEITVTGLPPLHRGAEVVGADGRVRGVRLERRSKDVKKLGSWSWLENPFSGTRELNGLRVMMALLNNWDLKETNNSIDEVDHERRFVVSDLGATFGRTGSNMVRSKSTLADYAGSPFIERIMDDSVDLVMHTRLFFLAIFDMPTYLSHLRMEQIAHRIPRADARWLGQRLALLSEEQIRDCFRAAGYSPEDVDQYARIVRARVAALEAL
jgi:hypothetical protein